MRKSCGYGEGAELKTMISCYKRRICADEDCEYPTRNKGFVNGRRRYGRMCEIHHKRLKSFKELPFFKGKLIDNSECVKCGWNEAYCDRHRINPKKGYTRKNVKVLCPNCHRLETIKGKIKI